MPYTVDVSQELEDIKLTPYGKKMRPALHSSIEKLSKKQNQMAATFDSLIIDAGQSNAEVVASRVDAEAKQHASLKDRLDADAQEVIDARTDAQSPSVTHDNLKERLDSDFDYLNSEIEKTNIRLSHITTHITYEMFGAKGDGVSDDFNAINKTHKYANANNLTVVGNSKANYYIKDIVSTIPIRTNVDWNGCKFTIDDRGVSQQKSIQLFTVEKSQSPISLNALPPIKKNQASIPEIANQINGKECIIYLEDDDEDKRIYIRTGGNKSDGKNLKDVFRIDSFGIVLDEILYDFDRVSTALAYPIDTERLDIKNGNFTTICNDEAGTVYYRRGILVERDNVVLTSISHTIVDQPNDNKSSSPYLGFISSYMCYNLNLKNCNLTAHKTYVNQNNVSMGSYDLRFDLSLGVKLDNVEQMNDITQAGSVIWGIFTSNGCKNITVIGSRLNRIDAHEGIHNLSVYRSELGYSSLTLIGSGKLVVEDTKFLRTSRLVNLREDYGSHWDGDMYFNHCTLVAPANFTNGFTMVRAENNGTHWYGYNVKFPNIYIDNLLIDDAHYHGLGRQIGHCIFDNRVTCTKDGQYNPQFPKNISIKNSTCTSEYGGFVLFRDTYVEQFIDGVCKTIQKSNWTTELKNRLINIPQITTNMNCYIENTKLILKNNNNTIADFNYNNILYTNDSHENFEPYLNKYKEKDVKGNYRVLPHVTVKNCDNLMLHLLALPVLLDVEKCNIIKLQQGRQGTHSYIKFVDCNFKPEHWLDYVKKTYIRPDEVNETFITNNIIFNSQAGLQEYHRCYFDDFGSYENTMNITQEIYDKTHSISNHLKFNNNSQKSVFRILSLKYGCSYSDKITFETIVGSDLEGFMNTYNIKSLFNFNGTVNHFRCYGNDNERPPRTTSYNNVDIPLPIGFRYFNTTTNTNQTWNGSSWV